MRFSWHTLCFKQLVYALGGRQERHGVGYQDLRYSIGPLALALAKSNAPSNLEATTWCTSRAGDGSQAAADDFRPLFRVLVLRRLRLPLPLGPRPGSCRRSLDALGNHRAACAKSVMLPTRALPLERALARVCREASASPT